MKPIHLIPLANGENRPLSFEVLEALAAALARGFRTPCRIRPETFDISFAWEERRGQYYSTAIIQKLERAADPDARILGVQRPARPLRAGPDLRLRRSAARR